MSTESHKQTCPFCQGLHWHTYENLENKLVNISRYIAIDELNFSTWSEELADLLVLTGNAVDTFFRNMFDCPYFRNEDKEKQKLTIIDYQELYESYYEFSNNSMTAKFPLSKEMTITPFSNFNNQTPNWWTAYNKVKHEYYENMDKANLINVLNSLGGLLLLNTLHLCSSYYLAINEIITSTWGSRERVPMYAIAEIVKNLLRSKIGTTIYSSQLHVSTRIFSCDIRVDRSVNAYDELIIDLPLKHLDSGPFWR